MQKLACVIGLTMLCSSAFAQDSYYVKAGGGAGTSNSSFDVLINTHKTNHVSVLSQQAQLNIGRTFGNWQLETGLGYLQTGLSFVLGPGGSGGCVVGPSTNPVIASQTNSVKYTITNPHLQVPLVLSYNFKSVKRFSVSPGAGVAALYNFKGKMTASGLNESSGIAMSYNYNNVAAAFLFKFDFQYRLCSHMSVWCSPSYEKMFTSLTTKVAGDYMSHIYDRALMMNVGVRFNLAGCSKPTAAKG